VVVYNWRQIETVSTLPLVCDLASITM